MKATVVVKVGGSLLDWDELPVRLANLLISRRNDRLVLIVGGGRFADALRHFDATHGMGEARAHALALRILDLTARMLADLVAGVELVEATDEIEPAWSRGAVPILAPRRFLDGDDRSPDPLPHAWTTTTDSIAARLAVRIGAGELVLLKSAPLPMDCDWVEAARLELVDPEFPRALMGLPRVTYLDFRSMG